MELSLYIAGELRGNQRELMEQSVELCFQDFS